MRPEWCECRHVGLLGCLLGQRAAPAGHGQLQENNWDHSTRDDVVKTVHISYVDIIML